jgi:hypothetical protein
MMKIAIALLTAMSASGCDGNLLSSDGSVFVLYRNSVTDENMRLHVATFDATDGENYNRGNS